MLRSFQFIARDLSLFLPLLILVVALPFFFVGGPTWMSGPLYRALWDLGHIVFFFSLLMLVQKKYPLDSWRWWVAVTLSVFLMGLVIEYLQSRIGRDGNWGDVLSNLTGAWLGLFWFQKARAWVWVGRVIASALLLPSLLLVAKLALLQYQVAQEFPLISSFEQKSDVSRWDGEVARSREHASQGDYSLKVILGNQPYPRAALRKFFGDWRYHQQLAFDIFNPDAESLAMTLRVHDAKHEAGKNLLDDRFNTRLMIEPGWNYYRVKLSDIELAPRTRKMELHLIRGVEIFSSGFSPARTIYLDNLRLE